MDESVIEHLEAPAKVLKLSEAIRIGAKLRPQLTPDAISAGHSCAFQAAFEAIHGTLCGPFDVLFWAARRFPELGDLQIEIVNLNDSGGWTREQIADWLEAQGY